MQDIFRGQGVEVDILSPDNFLKIKETLTRMGISSKRDNTLFQSCHILHKRDRTTDEEKSRYAILHFKELFFLDGKEHTLDDDDISRRNTITTLLEEWGLLNIVDPERVHEDKAPLNKIKIISFKEKANWKLESKYSVGTKKGR